MSLMIIVLMVVIAYILKDFLVQMPGFIVGLVDTIGHMPARRFAIIVLVIAGVVLLAKKK